jgi:hypothetical protein
MAETARSPAWRPTVATEQQGDAQQFDAWRDDYVRRNKRWPTAEVVWQAGYQAALQATRPMSRPCPQCEGKGSFKGEYVPDGWGTMEYVAPYACRHCHGTGTVAA